MKTSSLLLSAAVLWMAAGSASALPTPESPPPANDSLEPPAGRPTSDEAWWTGPLLAASPGTLPPGHFLIEPYLFDAMPRGHYDNDGNHHSGPHANNFGSQSYVLYGLAERLTVGLIPRFGFNVPSIGPSSSGIGVGDLTLQGQYRLSQYEEGDWIPTTAVVFAETLPTGRYDQLGEHSADGFGSGVYTTALSLFSQYPFHLPTGRILRARLDITYGLSSSAPLRDTSVYGTQTGFAGHVRPGNSLLVDGAGEYSLTRNWVLSFDVVYEHDSSTRVAGLDLIGQDAGLVPLPVQLDSGASRTLSLAPAVEYNFNAQIGIIAGAKLTAAGRNATASVIPVVAVNMVF